MAGDGTAAGDRRRRCIALCRLCRSGRSSSLIARNPAEPAGQSYRQRMLTIVVTREQCHAGATADRLDQDDRVGLVKRDAGRIARLMNCGEQRIRDGTLRLPTSARRTLRDCGSRCPRAVTIAFQGPTGFPHVSSTAQLGDGVSAPARESSAPSRTMLHPNPNLIAAATSRTIATMGRPISKIAMDRNHTNPIIAIR